jgi:hypothetical protein
VHDRLCQDRRGGGAVAGEIVGLSRGLALQLRAEVLELVGELDVPGDSQALLGDKHDHREPPPPRHGAAERAEADRLIRDTAIKTPSRERATFSTGCDAGHKCILQIGSFVTCGTNTGAERSAGRGGVPTCERAHRVIRSPDINSWPSAVARDADEEFQMLSAWEVKKDHRHDLCF